MKLTEFRAPFIGKGNVTNIGDLWSIVLGTGVMFIVFGAGQKLAQNVTGHLPGVQATMDRPWETGEKDQDEGPKQRMYGV